MIFSIVLAHRVGARPGLLGHEDHRVQRGEPALVQGVGGDEVVAGHAPGCSGTARPPASLHVLAWNSIVTRVAELEALALRLRCGDRDRARAQVGEASRAPSGSRTRAERLRVHADRRSAAAALEVGEGLRSWVTPATPSSLRIWSATSGENGWPTTLDTMNCEVSVLPIAASVLAEAEQPKIDIIAIRASPIIRALAVAAGTARVAQGVLGGQRADRAEQPAVDRAEQVQHRARR